ncbi:polymer-forming cytoskeletal family protein [Seongchinamella sediminis]|uniref:Polymer-forming cytoskeletal family protein n=1 Tax=Seongchinamella sediminis TaxID=2283635 RepID=A0A3L7DWH3_9GAMM|nr:polymer-forming cytoskeletal protein [Seongchinamella sediminis]RLQ21125.1 polymer-forming cytoskeletal family protein [Seongchinamella sediminis]
MLGNKKSRFGAGANTTLVARETTVVGDIHFSGSLDIEGVVQGNILAEEGKDALVRIIDKGRVQGEIRAPSVVVNGVVEGDVFSSKHLELAAKGCVHGNVHYTLLEMAAGSEVNGSLTHINSGEGKREKSQDPTVEVTEASAGKQPAPGKAASVKS